MGTAERGRRERRGDQLEGGVWEKEFPPVEMIFYHKQKEVVKPYCMKGEKTLLSHVYKIIWHCQMFNTKHNACLL